MMIMRMMEKRAAKRNEGSKKNQLVMDNILQGAEWV